MSRAFRDPQLWAWLQGGVRPAVLAISVRTPKPVSVVKSSRNVFVRASDKTDTGSLFSLNGGSRGRRTARALDDVRLTCGSRQECACPRQ